MSRHVVSGLMLLVVACADSPSTQPYGDAPVDQRVGADDGGPMGDGVPADAGSRCGNGQPDVRETGDDSAGVPSPTACHDLAPCTENVLAGSVLSGFSTESVAESTEVLGVRGLHLSVFLPGGAGSCAPHDGHDAGPDGMMTGWCMSSESDASPTEWIVP